MKISLAVEDAGGFKQFMRMDSATFRQLVSIIEMKVTKKCTTMRASIPPDHRLALTLRYLATGETFRSLEYQFRISRATISYIVQEVCEAIIDTLGETCLSCPSTPDEWLAVERLFSEKWNFPHCIGALDGKHIVIQACGEGSTFYNYKGSHSIILMVLAGPRYEVLWCNCGRNGRMSDGGVWNATQLCNSLEEKTAGIPPPEPLPNRSVPCPYVIVGDDAFSMAEYLVKPYPHQDLTLEQRVCNYRFSRARRIVENVFGILASRWRLFRSPIPLHPGKVKRITMAIVILHNWLIRGSCKDDYAPPSLIDNTDPESSEVMPGCWRQDVPPSSNMLPLARQSTGNKPRNLAKQFREEFKDYFNYEGQVSWQWAKCV